MLRTTPIALLALYAPVAMAASATQPYKDVPAGHWAEAAITAVAVDRTFMHGYPDGTFRGNEPFTRAQLAAAVAVLLKELEALTKTSWQVEGLGGYDFQDLPAGTPEREAVLLLANHYRLFEGVPGVTSRTFNAEKQVTRYEMAKVVHRLMRLGEQRGVVDPQVLAGRVHAFADLPTTAWDYDAVREVADRYQVMVGFPDGSFRGPEELTRYQFAATASQTFPLVKSLVARTQEHKEQPTPEPTPKVPWPRYLEATPVQVGVPWHAGNGWPGLGVRSAAYFGPLMAMGELELATGTPTGDRMYAGAGRLGYALTALPGLTITPTLGVRMVNNPAFTLGGLDYGVLAYRRTDAGWALYADVRGTSPLGATSGTALGTFLGSGGLGVELNFTPRIALTLEGGYAIWPTSVLATPTDALTTFGTPTAQVGLTFKL
ncbi:MAG: hypothetical protein JWM80_6029 [Cyanobacteria bacterium RYN_339]|nr:hypothetical protein [Cyanobacteria bacterium RYN_339]